MTRGWARVCVGRASIMQDSAGQPVAVDGWRGRDDGERAATWADE